MGRPKIVWSDKQYASLEYMALIHCTQKEMAGVMHVDEDTLNRLIKVRYDCSFSEFYERYSANGNMSLRRAQFKSAEAGNTSMQIWLGKQWLGQTDHQEIAISSHDDDTVREMEKYFEAKKATGVRPTVGKTD